MEKEGNVQRVHGVTYLEEDSSEQPAVLASLHVPGPVEHVAHRNALVRNTLAAAQHPQEHIRQAVLRLMASNGGRQRVNW